MAILQDRIKQRRLECGYTLAELAELLNVKEATVQRYESGEIKNIKHETIFKLSQILKCDPAYLMGWKDDVLTSNKKQLELQLTTHECELVEAYRQMPQMQAAVDRLLGIKETEPGIKVYRAARSDNNHEDEIITISAERLQRLKDAPETDEDL